MIVYFDTSGGCNCDIRSLIKILQGKEYVVKPMNKAIYCIDTDKKTMTGIDTIPIGNTDRIFKSSSSFKEIKSII